MLKKKHFTLGVLLLSLTAFILFITVNESKSNTVQVKATAHKITEIQKEKSFVEFPEKVKDTSINQEKEVTQSKKTKTKTASYTTNYVAVSELNVRSGPGTQHNVVGMVAINDPLKTKKGTSNKWVKVSSDNLSGYVNGKYLSDKKVTPVSSSSKTSGESPSEDQKSSKSNKKKKGTGKTQTPPPSKNDADKLNTIDANNQLILVTSKGYGTSSVHIQTFERKTDGSWKRVLSIPGFIGKNGFASAKTEGDGKSPRGKYSIGHAFGRNGNPGTKLPFKPITPDDVWVDDPKSSLYNTWQSKKETQGQWNSAENMDIPAYTYGFVINYNTQRTPGAGSAIFFHVANGHTLGCTGVSQHNMVSILKWLDPDKSPVIIQAPHSELGNY
ncbi:SH3 domain-containing protein [Virgibacillus sp. L01]|uniref:SH3 domain-containing protein n=1 Tax=Virgibacillus sp. L01 TaxID=3457429 RepID=UPI003FCFC5B7